MRLSRSAWLALSALSAAGALALAQGMQSESLAARARAMARPFVLPPLWNGIDAALKSGDLITATALGRDLMRYLPRWTDGHIHFAAQLVFDHGLRMQSTDEALQALDAGIGMLQDAEEALVADGSPQLASRLAAAQSSYLRIRCQQDPALANALQERSGRAPDAIALEALDRAIERADQSDRQTAGGRAVLRERRLTLLVGVAESALRSGATERALAFLDDAIEVARNTREPEAATTWTSALSRFRPVLLGESVDLERLRADPYLEGLVEAFQSR